VRTRDEGGANLTRAEARVTVRVLLAGTDASENSRFELVEPGAAATEPPIAASRTGRPVGVAPGTYDLRLWLREAPTAEGQGAVAAVTLPAGTATVVTLSTEFPTGSLVVKAENQGRDVGERTQLLLHPAGDKAPIRARAGGSIRLPVGDYGVTATLQTLHGRKHTQQSKIRIEPDRVQRLEIAFAVASSVLRLQVRDAGGRDRTAQSKVVVSRGKTRVAGGSAALDFPLPAGTYSVEVRWESPPFVSLTHTVPVLELKDDGEPTILPIPFATAPGELSFELPNTIKPDTCRVTLSAPGGKPLGTALGPGPHGVPAGTWDALVACGDQQRTLSGLVVTSTERLSRRVVLD
jgi:hypothetical protein